MTDPATAIGQLDAVYPLALLPVRLETRFRRTAGTVPGTPPPPIPAAPPSAESASTGPAFGELLVRIYPDAITADSHEPQLTANEVAAGQDYWRRAFADSRENDAWTRLLGEARAPRAAWIVDQTTPQNIAAMPSTPGSAVRPVFAAVPTRPDNWHRAPRARALPDCWVVSGFRDGVRVIQAISAPIRPDLALTPRLVGDDDPDATRFDLSGDGLTVEPDLAWAYDFDQAIAAGMAVRIPLTGPDLALGFTTLLAVGVRTTGSASDQADELTALLCAQRFSRGFAVVPQGTRTNNTGDAPSDYPPPDPAGTVSFGSARGTPPALTDTDGGRLATALGVGPSAVERMPGAGRDEQTPAAAMIDAIWPATIGYFLDQLFAPEVSQPTQDAVRAWMRTWIRPRGPLPAIRVGAVPYGVLPVAPLAPTTPAAVTDAPPGLSALIGRLAATATTLVDGAPHVDRSGDPDQDLIELLGMDASTATARIRRSMGYDTAWNMFGFTGTNMARWEADQQRIGQAALDAIGAAGRDPRAAYLSYGAASVDFNGPMVAPAPLSETDPLPFDYVAWLATADPTTLRAQTAPPSGEPVTALIFLMLRHALLTEYDRCARRLLQINGLLLAHEVSEPEMVAIVAATEIPAPMRHEEARPIPSPGQPESPAQPPGQPPTQPPGQPVPPAPVAPAMRTAWDRFALRVGGLTGDLTLGEFLAQPVPGGPGTPEDVAAALRELTDLRSALQTLSGRPTAELHRLFTETLDACSHRIDAWVTSFATRQLAHLRAASPVGTWLGGYGWVENLRADAPGDTVPVTLPDGTSTEAQRDGGGFISAPSMTHAATAAVLRSGYLARSGPARDAYSVDLSSARARSGLALLDGVRAEQPLGSVLGAAFERGLHEGHPDVELDRFIEPLRRLFPAVAGKTELLSVPVDAVAARSVVDGLALLLASQAGQVPWGTGDLTPSSTERTAIDAELAALTDAVDAVSDLLLAESVFQVVKGSPSGAAATLDTLAKGQRPAEPEVVATPRGGTVVHQRVAVLFDDVLPEAWQSIPATPRAAAAPEVNAWLAGLIGDPARIECTAASDGGSPIPVTVADLELQAIDVMLASAAGSGGGAELDARIAEHAGGAVTSVVIDYDTARPGSTPLGSVVVLLGAALGILGHGRPLSAPDLLPPEQASTPPADAMSAELADRGAAAVAALTTARSGLAVAADGGEPAAITSALRAVAAFGVAGAFPTPGVVPVPATLAALVADLDARLAAAAAATSAGNVLAAVFGRAMPVVPRFRPAGPVALDAVLAAEPDLTTEADAVVEGWLAQVSRVRPAVGAWCDVRLFGRALGSGGLGRPRIAQLPAPAGPPPRWAGLDFDDDLHRPASGLVSIAFVGAAPPHSSDPWSGLLLDAWPELLPSRQEDAGIAVHYDAPGAQAPQAVLVAVPPVGATWTLDHVERTLLDTVAMAKVRALDLSNLGAFAQFAPLTFLAANAANAAIATSFTGLLVGDAVMVNPAGG